MGPSLIIVICGFLFGWKWTGFSDRTLWDWLKLLLAVAVPAVLAYFGQRISTLQYRGQQEAEDKRAQDEALQAYLDQIGQLLLDKDRSLRDSKEGEEVRTLARARMLTVLRRLDSERKATVLQFLFEAGLVIKNNAIVDLKGADPSGASLSKADLSEHELRSANLIGADLSEAILKEAALSKAILARANLRFANLREAILRDANLSEANLREAILFGAHLSNAELHMADLRGADLRGADLSGANLRFANLRFANLRFANLRFANLRDAKRITAEKIEEQAYSLYNATMPNGQQYEDWLKSKGQEKNKKSDGSS